MRKCYIIAVFVFAVLGALSIAATAGAPNKPKPSCPPGYTEEPSSTHNMVLCTRETVREVIKTVPGPERIVEVFGTPVCVAGTTAQAPAANGAIICIKEVPVEVRVEVPGPERLVVKFKTKIKRVVVTKMKTRTVFKKFCPKKPNGDKIAG